MQRVENGPKILGSADIIGRRLHTDAHRPSVARGVRRQCFPEKHSGPSLLLAEIFRRFEFKEPPRYLCVTRGGPAVAAGGDGDSNPRCAGCGPNSELRRGSPQTPAGNDPSACGDGEERPHGGGPHTAVLAFR